MIMSAKQANRTIIEYANILKVLCQEINYYRALKTKCPEDDVALKEFIKQDSVYDFLYGLNPELDQV